MPKLFAQSIAHHRTAAEQAAKKAANYAQAARELIAQARAKTDPDLSAEGNAKARQLAVDKVASEARQAAATLHGENAASLDYLSTVANAVRPQIAETADGIAVARAAWDNVKSRLDRGVPPRQLLATANLNETLAFEKWGIDYLASLNRLGAEHEPHDFAQQITARLAHLSEPEVGEVLLAADNAVRQIDAAKPWLNVLADPTGTHDVLGVAIASKATAGTAAASEVA